MRIAQVCAYDFERPGGVQTHIRDLSCALQELGHQVCIIAPDTLASRDEAAARTVPVTRIGRARSIRFGGTEFEISIALGDERRRLATLMRDGQFDVMHYHAIWTPLLPLQVLNAARAPAVATFHDTPADTVGGALTRAAFRALSRWLAPRLDGVIAVSEAPLRHLSIERSRLRIVPPVVDLRRFAAAPPAPDKLRDGRLTILFLGRLEPRKGLMTLLVAYQRLVGLGIPARLVIAGGGRELDALRRFVAEQRLSHVAFIGAVAESDKPALYAACDVFCAPSWYGESFGIVIAEAMASGKPIVAASNPGYALLLRDRPEQLVPPRDADALCRRLAVLAGDPALRRRLGAWGRAESARYDSRRVAPEIVAVYEQAIRASRLAA